MYIRSDLMFCKKPLDILEVIAFGQDRWKITQLIEHPPRSKSPLRFVYSRQAVHNVNCEIYPAKVIKYFRSNFSSLSSTPDRLFFFVQKSYANLLKSNSFNSSVSGESSLLSYISHKERKNENNLYSCKRSKEYFECICCLILCSLN